MKDYYGILGVKKTSSTQEIKKSYKNLSRKYHPDKNPDNKEAEDKFKDISEAYDTLSNEEKKSHYDSKMSYSFDFNRHGYAFGKSDATSFKRPPKPEPPKGDDLKATLSLTLEQIYSGCEKTIKLNKWNICNICDGTGAKTMRTCSVCKGEGKVRKIQKTSMLSRNITVQVCNKCYGNGLEIETPCLNCQGRGRIREQTSIKVKIPKVISEDNFIIIPGQGDAGKSGGRQGDLKIFIDEIPHPIFKRIGNDLHTTVEVQITDVVLGAVIRAPSLFEKIDIKIPAGTQLSESFRIKGKGLGEKGDLFISLKLIIPIDLDEEHKKTFEKLRLVEKKFKFNIE